MESRMVSDEVIEQLEEISLEIRKLQVKQNRILTDEAKRLDCDPLYGWKFNPALYEFVKPEPPQDGPAYSLDQ